MVKNIFSKTYHRRMLEKLLMQHAHHLMGSLLDIGSKNRRYSHLFKGTITAIDTEPNSALNIIYGDLDKTLPFQDKTFDGILCVEVLEYVRDVNHAIAEIHRLLKADGTALLSIPFLYHDHDDWARYTVGSLKEKLTIFSSTKLIPFGNGWTVIGDIMLKKTVSSSSYTLRLIGFLFLTCYDKWLSFSKIDAHSDRYYSGIFIIAHK